MGRKLMSASTILTSKRGFVRSSAFLAASLAFAAALPMSAVADTAKANPVTGETETYTWKFVGTDTWGQTQYWQDSGSNPPSGVPAKTSDNTWDPILFDGNTININDADLSVEGWNLRMGLYNGATVTINNLVKYQGDTTMWTTVDESSQLTIGGFGGGNITANQVIKLSVAKANGITWTANLTSGNANNTFEYYLKGAGSVSYQAVTAANHKIKMADVTLTGTSQVSHKTLVSFTSAPTFTADASIKVLNGSTVVATKALTAVNTTATLTTDNAVGTCELVQTSTGIDLYWVDGDPANLPAATVYKPSININFTNGAGNGLTTQADVGLADYEVPGISWNNYVVANNTFSTVNAIDSTGAASAMSGVSVKISNVSGSWGCSGLTASSDFRQSYIDESASYPTPTVTVSGIPYYKYRVLVYHSTDTKNVPFGYDTINGTNYTYVNDALAEGTTAWGDSGAKDSANAIAEGGNVLVTGELSGSTLTVVGHRAGGANNARGCIAAIQIIEVKADVGENDLEIPVSGDTQYTVEETKELSGTVYLTGLGTLTLAGENKISAATIEISEGVTLVVNADRLDATTFTGAGTVVYDGVVPPTGKGWTDSAWTGTVWLKNKSDITGNNNAATGVQPNSLGNANSKVKFSGVSGWIEAPVEFNPEIILENAGYDYALRLTNGNSPNSTETNRCTVVKKLSGSGTLCCGGTSAAVPTLKVYDAAGFTGSINTVNADDASKTGLVVVFCDESTNLPDTLVNMFINSGLKRTVYVATGKTVTLDSAATWTAETGFVVQGTLTANGTLASSHATKAVSGAGTVVFGGVPSPTGDAWWKNSAWNGTVQIGNITDMIGRASGYTGTYLDFNSYGNANSLVKLGNLTGWMDNYTCNVPVNLAGTLTINNGISGEVFTFKKLISSGGYITATDQSATFSIRIEDGSEYAGYIGLNSKRVIFGTGTAPDFVKGQIYVSSDATITVPSVNTAYWSVGGILVDGELKADNLARFGGGTNITTGDDGVFTLTSTGNGSEGETDTDYARIKGTGFLKYDGTGWRALSTNNFPTAVTLVNEQAGDILLSRALTYTVGSLSGSKNFQGNYGSGNRYLNVIQSKDTEWSGKVVNDGSSRFAGLKLDASSTGTLTLSGTASQNVALEVNGGAVNLTGTWVGATTVAGTFGGTGTLTGNLTFSDGATFKAFSTDSDGLSVSGTVTFPTEEGESTTVDLSGITLDVSGTTLITAASINDISTLSVSGALLALENGGTVLKAYPVAALTYTENEATTTIACSSVQDAVNQAYARECQNKTYDYITVYASANATAYSATVKVKLANDATFTIAPASPEYGAYSAGSAGEDGVVTYTSATNPTTYTWAGAQEGIWAAAVNWQYGESLPASRYPVAGDTVIINDGATIRVSSDVAVAGVQVSGAATINGSGTVAAERDGIVLTDAAASIAVADGVALSPLPTTTVENAKVKSATAAGVTTYLVAFVYTLTLDGTATTWSGGTWTYNNQGTVAPTSGYVEIVARASTELTVDTAVSLVDLSVSGGEDIVVNMATNDTGSLYSLKVTIENGVFQQGSPAVLGATPSIIVEDGATFDMNGLGINAATKVYLAGAGAGSWPWALTSSSGAGGAILGGLYLTDDATIGGANELKIGQYSTTIGYHCYLQGHTMTKIGEGALTCHNMNTPGVGAIDVYGGAMSVNSYNNLNNTGGDTTVILHTGASLANGTDRVVPMGTLKLLGGTLTTARAFKVKTLLTGSGETANLAFADGASASLTGDLTVTAALTLDGAMAFSKDENAANDVVVTASGTMSSSGAISVGAGVTLNLGTNRPAATFDVDDDATLAIQLRNETDTPVVHVTGQPKNLILYDAEGDVVSGPIVAYDSENGTIMISSVNVWTKVKNESFDDGDNWSAGTPPSSGNAAVFVTDTTGITVGNAYTLSALGISGAGDLTISGAGSIAAQTFDFSGATGRVEYNLSTGSADVRSGSNTLILGGGSGTPTVASGQTLTLGAWGANDGDTYTYSSKFAPDAGSTLLFAPGGGRTQKCDGFDGANVGTTIGVTNGTLVVDQGGASESKFFGQNSVRIDNGGILSLEAQDALGWGQARNLTINNGGVLAVKVRDTLRRTVNFNGGSITIEGVNSNRGLDFFGLTMNVADDSSIDQLEAQSKVGMRNAATVINVNDGKTLAINANLYPEASGIGLTVRAGDGQSKQNGIVQLNGYKDDPKQTFDGVVTVGEANKAATVALNCEHENGTYVVNAASRFLGTGSVTGNGGVTLVADNSKLCGSLTVNNLTAASGGTYGDQWNAVAAKVATSYFAAGTQAIENGSFTIGADCVATNSEGIADTTAAEFSIATNGNLRLEKSVTVAGLTAANGGTVTLVAASKDSVPALNVAGTGSYNEKVNIVLDFGTARIPLGRTYTLMTGSVPNIDNVVVRDNKSERKWKLSFVGNDLKATSDTWFHIRLR